MIFSAAIEKIGTNFPRFYYMEGFPFYECERETKVDLRGSWKNCKIYSVSIYRGYVRYKKELYLFKCTNIVTYKITIYF